MCLQHRDRDGRGLMQPFMEAVMLQEQRHRDGRGLIQPFLEAVMLQEQWMYFFLAKLTCYMSIYIIVS
uniref:Uncharacterized protein n=1 Tax=Helianthus annuus TaxID=4232 RepID=A0A251T521_HELAN